MIKKRTGEIGSSIARRRTLSGLWGTACNPDPFVDGRGLPLFQRIDQRRRISVKIQHLAVVGFHEPSSHSVFEQAANRLEKAAGIQAGYTFVVFAQLGQRRHFKPEPQVLLVAEV